MGRWVTGFILVFILGTLIAGSIDSQANYAVTYLNGAITSTDTTITVDSTVNFPPATAPATGRRFYIGNEVAQYTGRTSTQFTGVTRGVADPKLGTATEADSHADNTKVMSLVAKTISSVAAINIITSGASFGSIAAYVVTGTALKDLFKTLTWDYPWFKGNAVFFRLPLFAFSAGFLWAIAMVVLQLAQGVLRSV